MRKTLLRGAKQSIETRFLLQCERNWVSEPSLVRMQVDSKDAEQGWGETFDLSLHSCMHGPGCQGGESCQMGRRQTTCSIVTGSVVPIWSALEKVLEKNEGLLRKSDRTMRAVRAEPEGGGRLVGLRYPTNLLPEVRAVLEAATIQDATNKNNGAVKSKGVERVRTCPRLVAVILPLHSHLQRGVRHLMKRRVCG